MKGIWLSLVILMWTGFSSLNGQSGFSFGAKAGISLANQSYRITPIDYTLETEPVAGPAASLLVEAFRGDHFSFQVDISYALKGSRSGTQSISVNHLDNDRITVNEGEMTTSSFSYLSLAPMARYRVGKGSLQPYFLLGPRLDMLLYYKSDSVYPLTEQNPTILGLNGGVGLELKLQRIGLFIELLYQPDLSPVTGDDPLLINNDMISLTLGVRLFSSG